MYSIPQIPIARPRFQIPNSYSLKTNLSLPVRPKARVLALIIVMPRTNRCWIPAAGIARCSQLSSSCQVRQHLGCPLLAAHVAVPCAQCTTTAAHLEGSLTPPAAHITLDIGTAAAGPSLFSVPVLARSIHDHHPPRLTDLDFAPLVSGPASFRHTPLTYSIADIGCTCSNPQRSGHRHYRLRAISLLGSGSGSFNPWHSRLTGLGVLL